MGLQIKIRGISVSEEILHKSIGELCNENWKVKMFFTESEEFTRYSEMEMEGQTIKKYLEFPEHLRIKLDDLLVPKIKQHNRINNIDNLLNDKL